MVGVQAVFRYKTIKGPLHKLPAVLKLILFLPLSVFCLSLSSSLLAAEITAAAIIAFLCGFTLREQLTDLKPVFFYAGIMYFLSVLSNLFENWDYISLIFNSFLFLPRREFIHITLRLVLIVQISALLFRTTSSLQIREVIRIEIISLFFCFIPEIFETWSKINTAWKARGGKHGFAKIKNLVFVLISLCFEKAAVKSRAYAARKVL
jgi:biotin transport system permease protein/energy-coupling factor transport system permease protein